mgnify:CR=1 FL=1
MRTSRYEILHDNTRCDLCKSCVYQCTRKVFSYDIDQQRIAVDSKNCVNCQRCVEFCHHQALKVQINRNHYHENAYWTMQNISQLFQQADTGGILLSSMGNSKPYPIYFDHLLLNAAQVTNPSIDPLREPMETKVCLGKRTNDFKRDSEGLLKLNVRPHLHLDTPILFAGMSLGAISYPAHEALLAAAKELNTFYNCGEGGLPQKFYPDENHIIVQVASGRFGINKDYLKHCAALEIKVGQGAKPGIGGHLPSIKNKELIAKTRMIEENSEAISPAPHHDIYSIEDLRQLVFALKEVSGYQKPIIVKVAAVHNIAAICSGIARSGADIIYIDGFRGGSGATPMRIRDNVGIPIELALASVDETLRKEGIREEVSVIAAGGIRNSSDVVKAIALGADAVAIGTAALLALGCHLCQDCTSGVCSWGIATQQKDLTKRLNPIQGARKLVHLVTAWTNEIKEMMGGMGISSIESLKGNRLMLRGIHLHEEELRILGIKHAGSR